MKRNKNFIKKENPVYFVLTISVLIWLTTLNGENTYNYLLEKGCNLNIVRACHSLGYILYDVDDKKIRKGLYYNKKSCDLMYGSSCFNLGLYYQSINEINQSRDYYKKSCHLAISTGCMHYANIVKNNEIEEKIKYMKRACDMRNHNACNEVSLLVEKISPHSK